MLYSGADPESYITEYFSIRRWNCIQRVQLRVASAKTNALLGYCTYKKTSTPLGPP